MDIDLVERVLDTYSLDEILELNDISEADVLYLLLEEELVTLPNVIPVDL